MDDLEAFLIAQVDQDQKRAEAMRHFTVYEQPYYSCPASRTPEEAGDLEWGEEHCDCFLAERKARALREVAAKRHLLELADRAYYAADHYAYHWIRGILAVVYSDRAGYQEEWAQVRA